MRKLEIRVFSTCQSEKQWLKEERPLLFRPDRFKTEEHLINLYPDVVYQRILGFGGAFTDAAAYHYSKMSDANRKRLLAAYFSADGGIGYNFCRTTIGSCDFATDLYDYAEKGDMELNSFQIDFDRKHVIPFIRDAIRTASEKLVLYASPWSPPGWMKTNNSKFFGGRVKPECLPVWANYFVKYILAYRQEAIPIWGVTIQNEPNAVQTWESCIFSAQEEAEFIRWHLGPALDRAGLRDIQIFIWDHNKERLYERACETLKDPVVADRVSGIGFHWYAGSHFEALDAAHMRFPDMKLVMTELCERTETDQLEAAEKYAHEIIGNLNHYTCAITDWNLILDHRGGPHHKRLIGGCLAPVLYDEKTDALTFTALYYYIGHFSKFIKRGARRIGFSSFTDVLEVCAFQNPDAELAVIVLNRTDKRVHFTLRLGDYIAKTSLHPHAIKTFLLSC